MERSGKIKNLPMSEEPSPNYYFLDIRVRGRIYQLDLYICILLHTVFIPIIHSLPIWRVEVDLQQPCEAGNSENLIRMMSKPDLMVWLL